MILDYWEVAQDAE